MLLVVEEQNIAEVPEHTKLSKTMKRKHFEEKYEMFILILYKHQTYPRFSVSKISEDLKELHV